MKKNLILGLLIISLSASNAAAQDSTSTSFKIGLGCDITGGSDGIGEGNSFGGLGIDVKMKLSVPALPFTIVGTVGSFSSLFDEAKTTMSEYGVGVEFPFHPMHAISLFVDLNTSLYHFIREESNEGYANYSSAYTTFSNNGIGVGLGAGIEFFPYAPLSLELEAMHHAATNSISYSQVGLRLLCRIK
jgi:hypothetical protein